MTVLRHKLNESRDERINALAETMVARYWQDPERVSDAVNDAVLGIGWYRAKDTKIHPLVLTFLGLIRDGKDYAEIGRMLHKAVEAELISSAESDAADAIDRADEEALENAAELAYAFRRDAA